MKLLSLLLTPALALAGTFSGTVVSLDGTPVAGATIKVGTDSVTTTSNGAWSLARAVGIATGSGKAAPVASHLTLENGRPHLSFGGMDISGRTAHKPTYGQIPSNLAAARSQAASDTLRVYWKGKRLTVLPLPSDTGALTFKIDTTWKDDAGIPWNPRIAYGSLFDTRDSQTYRTVTIGTQTWMAENLALSIDSSWTFGNNPDTGMRYGRLYPWTSAMALDDSCRSKDCRTQVSLPRRGICPLSWHVSDTAEWRALNAIAGGDTLAARRLRAASAWPLAAPSTDTFGFRLLPSGAERTRFTAVHGNDANFWIGGYSEASSADVSWITTSLNWVFRSHEDKPAALSVRCIKDTP